jgi:hypothetical protein
VTFGAEAVLAGPPASTTCALSDNYRVDGPHFNPNPPSTTFSDPGGDPNQCGDLTFNNRTRSFTSIYASRFAEESPWKYWWQRARFATSGATAALAEVRKVSRAVDVPDTAQVQMWLSDQYDVIGTQLILSSSATEAISEQAFTEASANPGMNIAIQHWRHIDAPVLNSATVVGDDVTLGWSNSRDPRSVDSVDSTNIYRNGAWRATVGPAVSSFVDPNLPPGPYTYTLKHVSLPFAHWSGPPWPNSASSNGIQVTVGPPVTACASAEYLSTWKAADQYLSAGCSQLGGNKRFRWFRAGGVPLSGWTTDTLFDFLGHSQTGAQLVVLKDSNTTTGAISVDTLSFSVANDQLTVSGPTLIRDKKKKLYIATNAAGQRHSGFWFARYPDGLQWYSLLSTEQDSLPRIWPMGEYTLVLRQHRVPSGVLHRDRLAITVCSSPGCEPANAPVALSGSLSGEGATAWNVFGAGPWIGWGESPWPNVLRWYDLWGMHDRLGAFENPAWLEGTGGRFADIATGWDVTWAWRDLGLADVRVFDFTLAGAGTRPYVFGTAVDPDLGANAADDVASWDAERGLVIVADASRAVGFLLRRAGKDALASAQEYGVGRWAPTTADYAWAAQRAAGTRLVGTPRDVQLVLSAGPTSGDGTWQFVVIRGASPTSVRATADAVLRGLQ